MLNYDLIYEQYKVELQNVITYIGFIEVANNAVEKQVFRDIAKEKYQHASILKHLLYKAGEYREDPMLSDTEESVEKAVREI